MVNLESFKLSKSQMNNVIGGKHFHCIIGDHVASDYHGNGFTLDYYDFAESATYDEAEKHVRNQLGDNFSVSCIAMN